MPDHKTSIAVDEAREQIACVGKLIERACADMRETAAKTKKAIAESRETIAKVDKALGTRDRS